MVVEPLGVDRGIGATDDGDAVGRVRIGEAADRPSVAVVEAIERATGEPPASGELYRAIDPDALDNLFADRLDGSPRDGGTLSFVVGDCVVAVHADGRVTAAAV